MSQLTVFRGVFLDGTGRGSFRVTFADDVSMLAVGSPTVCSPVLEEPAPLVSPIVVEDVVIPEGEMYGLSDVVPDAIQPPPGFLPFPWPIASECVAFERFGSSLGSGALPDVLVSSPDVEPPSSPIAQDQVSASVDSPEDCNINPGRDRRLALRLVRIWWPDSSGH